MSAHPTPVRRLPRTSRIGSAVAILATLSLLAAAAAASPRGSFNSASMPIVTVRASASALQSADVQYDPRTREVTIKTSLLDTPKEAVTEIRRNSFIVYENGVRQHNVNVSIEHRPVSIGVLVEFGGRYRALNERLGETIEPAINQLLQEIGAQDALSIWKYADRVEPLTLAEANSTAQESGQTGRPVPRSVRLTTPPFSETNFYDALLETLPRIQAMSGAKALILVSTGLDTFSQARFPDVLAAVRNAHVPIYILDIGPALHSSLAAGAEEGSPYARLNWNRAQAQLAQIARASEGRLYEPGSGWDFSAVYDDLMADLRLEYVIRYPSAADALTPRTVQVDLVDSNGTRAPVLAVHVSANSLPSAQSTTQSARTGA